MKTLLNHPPLVGAMVLVPCALTSDGWMCIPHADGKWVTAARLDAFSFSIVEYWFQAQPSKVAPTARPSPCWKRLSDRELDSICQHWGADSRQACLDVQAALQHKNAATPLPSASDPTKRSKYNAITQEQLDQILAALKDSPPWVSEGLCREDGRCQYAMDVGAEPEGRCQVGRCKMPCAPDPLSDFKEGQWWVNELDAAARSASAGPQLKRAVAVVHHLLRSAARAQDEPKPAEVKHLPSEDSEGGLW